MNLNRTFQVARKTLIEILREPVLLLLVLAIPAFFMLICYVGYGTSPKAATYRILVQSTTDRADAFLAQLAEVQYTDGRPYFKLEPALDPADAETQLKEHTAAAMLTIGENSTGVLEYTIRGDAMYLGFIKASAQLESLIIPFLEKEQDKPQHFVVVLKALERPRPASEFDAYVPGMMLMAILLIIPQTAMLIGRERRNRTLRRLELSLLRPAELLGGICLAQLVVAVLQVVVMFAAALLLGFHNRGSLGLAMLIGLCTAFASVGLGLLVGCFIKNDTDALNTGSTVSMLMVFLSGAFFSMPSPVLFNLFDYPVGAFDFIPATNGMLALQQVLSGGAGMGDVWFRVCACLALSLFFFWMGVLIFSLFEKKRES